MALSHLSAMAAATEFAWSRYRTYLSWAVIRLENPPIKTANSDFISINNSRGRRKRVGVDPDLIPAGPAWRVVVPSVRSLQIRS